MVMLGSCSSLRAACVGLTLLSAAGLGCQSSGSEPASVLNMVDADEVSLLVQDGSRAPIPRAFVKILAQLDPQEVAAQAPPEVLFEAMTGEDGRVVGRYARPSAVQRVALLVMKTGMMGPYTEPRRRLERPHFAPASWQVLEPGDLSELTITLVKDPNL